MGRAVGSLPEAGGKVRDTSRDIRNVKDARGWNQQGGQGEVQRETTDNEKCCRKSCSGKGEEEVALDRWLEL